MRRTALPLVPGLLAILASACASEPPPKQTAPTASAPPPPPPSVVPSAVASADPVPPPKPKTKNVLLVSIDSLRADMPWMGYSRDIAPNLTKLAKSAVSYTRFYSISSYTAAGLGGLLAGRYPSELERSHSFFLRYPESVTFFPELLQKAGVRTVSAHAHFYFDTKSGFRQGFDDYEILPGLKNDNKTDPNVTSPLHTETAIKMLSDKANTNKPFFAWFHYLDPHDQYVNHDGFGPFGNGKSARDKYDSEVAFTDHYVQKLFDFVDKQPWGKETAIFVTADHGEAFGEHKHTRHGFELWECLVHVPLIVKIPGMKPRSIDATRSAIDLAPTFLDLLGAPKDPLMRGQSLVAEFEGADAKDRDVLSDLPRTTDNDRRRAFVSGSHKLIAFGDDHSYELYDVVKDPEEKVDLRKKDPKLFEDMKAKYKAMAKTIPERCPITQGKMRGKPKDKPC